MATLPRTRIGSKRVEFGHVLLIVFLKNGIGHRRGDKERDLDLVDVCIVWGD